MGQPLVWVYLYIVIWHVPNFLMLKQGHCGRQEAVGLWSCKNTIVCSNKTKVLIWSHYAFDGEELVVFIHSSPSQMLWLLGALCTVTCCAGYRSSLRQFHVYGIT